MRLNDVCTPEQYREVAYSVPADGESSADIFMAEPEHAEWKTLIEGLAKRCVELAPRDTKAEKMIYAGIMTSLATINKSLRNREEQ
jgi:hypothetical protein